MVKVRFTLNRNDNFYNDLLITIIQTDIISNYMPRNYAWNAFLAIAVSTNNMSIMYISK